MIRSFKIKELLEYVFYSLVFIIEYINIFTVCLYVCTRVVMYSIMLMPPLHLTPGVNQMNYMDSCHHTTAYNNNTPHTAASIPQLQLQVYYNIQQQHEIQAPVYTTTLGTTPHSIASIPQHTAAIQYSTATASTATILT